MLVPPMYVLMYVHTGHLSAEAWQVGREVRYIWMLSIVLLIGSPSSAPFSERTELPFLSSPVWSVLLSLSKELFKSSLTSTEQLVILHESYTYCILPQWLPTHRLLYRPALRGPNHLYLLRQLFRRVQVQDPQNRQITAFPRLLPRRPQIRSRSQRL
jgi:hypothetical protein